MERRPAYLGPLLLISIGFILLFNKLGLLQLGAWGSLLHYWPIILILWGIEILAMNTESEVLYFTALFLSIVMIIGIVLLASNGYPPPDKKGDNLRGIIFTNKYLEDMEFNFADLDYADFNNSNLNWANMNFADLKYADLKNSVLDGANLNFVDFDGANMSGARLKGANYVFAGTSKSTICPDSTNGPCW